jgi:hypothetical protein
MFLFCFCLCVFLLRVFVFRFWAVWVCFSGCGSTLRRESTIPNLTVNECPSHTNIVGFKCNCKDRDGVHSSKYLSKHRHIYRSVVPYMLCGEADVWPYTSTSCRFFHSTRAVIQLDMVGAKTLGWNGRSGMTCLYMARRPPLHTTCREQRYGKCVDALRDILKSVHHRDLCSCT